MRPLGRQQLRLLMAMGSPSLLLLTPAGRLERSLLERELGRRIALWRADPPRKAPS